MAADERESGVRATLNLGHTFGHAIETGQGYGVYLLCLVHQLGGRRRDRLHRTDALWGSLCVFSITVIAAGAALILSMSVASQLHTIITAGIALWPHHGFHSVCSSSVHVESAYSVLPTFTDFTLALRPAFKHMRHACAQQ